LKILLQCYPLINTQSKKFNTTSLSIHGLTRRSSRIESCLWEKFVLLCLSYTSQYSFQNSNHQKLQYEEMVRECVTIIWDVYIINEYTVERMRQCGHGGFGDEQWIQVRSQSGVRYREHIPGASHLPTLRLITAIHSSRCLEAFYCSSAVSGWWSIATWTNGYHSRIPDRIDSA